MTGGNGVSEVQIRVGEAKQRDVARGIARIDQKSMEKLKVSAGDVIEIVGKRRTSAIAWPAYSEDQDRGIVRIDGFTRKNAGVSINEYITIRRAEVKDATSIVLAPIDMRLNVDEDFIKFVKNRLMERTFIEGDTTLVMMLGHPVQFTVTKTRPQGIIKLTYDTKLQILTEPAPEAKDIPRTTYEDIGGLKEEIQRLREIVELPMRHPELFQRLGIGPPKGVLLQGPPGCGKTLLARAVANESDANFFSINGPEIMSKFYGESEARLREIFQQAEKNAPAIIFIDELDAIAPKREEVTGEVERRVVAQILALLDGLKARGNVIVIGATNRPNALDPALRRPGRFDREIEIGMPDKQGRHEVLQIHTRGMPLSENVDVKRLAETTHGYTGADLAALGRETAMKALRRYLPEFDLEEETVPPSVLEKMEVTMEDFINAFKEITPTAMREVAIEVPTVHWNEVGNLGDVKKELRESVEWPLKHSEIFERMGIQPPKGILLFGPPGLENPRRRSERSLGRLGCHLQR
jgi:transitional endoplasmic reticulum ATPase